MAKYAIFESTNLGSTKYAERIYDAVATTDVENGTFGYLDGLADGEDNTYNFKTGTSAKKQVVVVNQPAWTEDNTSRITNQRRDKFCVEAGTRFRVDTLKLGDEFAISAEAVTAATQAVLAKAKTIDSSTSKEIEVYLTIDTTGKLVASTSSTASAKFEATIRRKRTVGATISTVAHNYGYATVVYEAQVTTLA